MLSEDQAFALLKRRVLLDRGLDCEQYKENYLKRRIAVRLRATSSRDYLEYLRILKNDPEEYTHLLNELTINVTQFFRDEDVYEKLREKIFPDILQLKRELKSKTVRIWSVGCASGEEPYSVAMLLDYLLGPEGDDWNLRVVGSDIDEGSLQVARKGIYSESGVLEGMEPDRYFEVVSTEEGPLYKVRWEIKRRVRLEKFNLLEEMEPRHFDMIMCRNVLIYFGRDVQKRVIEDLASSILGEGYLVLGKSETLGQEAGHLFRPVFPRERIYQVITSKTRHRLSRGSKNG